MGHGSRQGRRRRGHGSGYSRLRKGDGWSKRRWRPWEWDWGPMLVHSPGHNIMGAHLKRSRSGVDVCQVIGIKVEVEVLVRVLEKMIPSVVGQLSRSFRIAWNRLKLVVKDDMVLRRNLARFQIQDQRYGARVIAGHTHVHKPSGPFLPVTEFLTV